MRTGRTSIASKRRILFISKMVWLAMLLWPFLISLIVITSEPGVLSSVVRGWLDIGVGLSLLLIPVGYHFRLQIYKRYWQGFQISPLGYLGGNVALWVCCSVVVVIGLASMLSCGSFWAAMAAMAAVVMAVLVELVNFPNGLAMEPSELALGSPAVVAS